jgi:hypothetical protein
MKLPGGAVFFCREGFSQISADLSRKARNAEDEQNSVSRMKIKPITHRSKISQSESLPRLSFPKPALF